MKCHRFIILGTSHKTALAQSLNKDVQAWRSDWLSNDISIDLKIRTMSEGLGDYQELNSKKIENSHGDRWAVYSMSDSDCNNVGSLLICNQDVRHQPLLSESILCNLVHLAVKDLIQRILRSDKEETYVCACEMKLKRFLPADAFRIGGEAIFVILRLEEASCILCLPILPLLPRITTSSDVIFCREDNMVPPSNALADQRLAAWVGLGWAELTVSLLANLKVGDVIRLDKDLQEPLSLVVEKSSAKFKGYLGKRGDHLAFKVSAMLLQK